MSSVFRKNCGEEFYRGIREVNRLRKMGNCVCPTESLTAWSFASHSVIIASMKTVALLLTLLIACCTLGQAQVFDREQAMKMATAATLMVPGSQMFSVAATGSMKPMMDENCIIVTTKEPFENVTVRDIVLYVSETGQMIVHRVMEKRKDGSLWTLGDNNHRPDREYVTKKNYIGKVCSVVYYRGTALPTGQIASASRL
jgi:signal peptidase I